ncbi:MAG: hypothetical protein DMF80_11090 [Acidobacteria bacterium]|nr:MAG: hypothetical protein DMF80_11090 [Acidobacteriota bacterium]
MPGLGAPASRRDREEQDRALAWARGRDPNDHGASARAAPARLSAYLPPHEQRQSGQSIKDLRCAWRNALEAAPLPEDRLFHDLRRSAVWTLIRSGVDPSVAMKVSGHKTRSMLDRYNIVEETETAAALAKADAYLSTQPSERNVEALGHAQNAHIQASRRKTVRNQPTT